MSESILNSIGIDPGIIMILLMVMMVFVLLYLVRVSMKLSRFTKRYRIFMRGKDAVSLEKAFAQKFLEMDKLVEVSKNQNMEIARIKDILARTTNKIGIVKYDAFPDIGGKLSFVLALLNDESTGIVLNAIHSKDNCFLYLKEIVKGESYIMLSKEEIKALNIARNKEDTADIELMSTKEASGT